MTINVKKYKEGNENNAALIRRFTRAVQGSKLIRHVRDTRYHQRDFSNNVKRKQKIKYLKRVEGIKRLVKLGKLPDKTRR